MNRDKIYTQWVDQRRQVSVPEGFSERVMAQVRDREPNERFWFFHRFGQPPHFLARWAAALGLIALGIYRIFFVTANLLLGSTL